LEVRMQRLDALTHRLVHPRDAMRDQSARLSQLTTRLTHAASRYRDDARWRLTEALQRQRACLPHIDTLRLRVGAPAERMGRALTASLERHRANVMRLAGALEHLGPRRVLERGYSIVSRADGSVLADAAHAKVGETLNVELARGRLETRVEKKL
jgi:exodeoxyribonuclease VII large subunit